VVDATEEVKILSILKTLGDLERNASGVEEEHAFYKARWIVLHHYPNFQKQYGEALDEDIENEKR
jgi:hypothetical protein